LQILHINQLLSTHAGSLAADNIGTQVPCS